MASADARAYAKRAERDRAQRAGVEAFASGRAPSRGSSNRLLARGGGAWPPVDLDIATEAEIEPLPYVGGALARRIIGDREARGPFGSIDGLRRVPGVGASLAAKLAPHVTFSLTPRLGSAGEPFPVGSAGRTRGAQRP